jgi:hypothetical protein
VIDRKEFYSQIRATLVKGGLNQSQVDGFEAILDEWERRNLSDLRWLAYIMATAWHETAQRMQPIEEYGRGKGKAYAPTYYGRGFVQITWERNYARLSDVIGVDLVTHPEKAMEMDNAIQILFEGMIDGLFTGKKLSDYFGKSADWRGARAIVNGKDRAADIAGYAKKIWDSLRIADGDTLLNIAPDDDFVLVRDNHGDVLQTYYPPATPNGVMSMDATKPAAQSKIVWTQLLTAAFAIFAGFGLSIPPEFQQLAIELLAGGVTATSLITAVMRIWFTNKILK